MKVLKFYASWCAPCKGLAMVVDSIRDFITTEIEDIDIEQYSDLAVKYGVRSVPTMVVLDDSGNVIRRKTGMMNEEELLEFIGE